MNDGQLKTARYSLFEERANSLTHLLGAFLSLAAIGWLVERALRSDDLTQLVTVLVFGLSLLGLYLASALYHGVVDPRLKGIFHVLDHVGIYLLIAGTYTPITLLGLRGSWGLGLFIATWSIALLGISFEAFWVERPKWVSVAIYVAMGWMAVLAIGPMRESLSTRSLYLLLGGGLVYTGGTLFYLLKLRFSHALWHLFVIGGSALHVLAVGSLLG